MSGFYISFQLKSMWCSHAAYIFWTDEKTAWCNQESEKRTKRGARPGLFYVAVPHHGFFLFMPRVEGETACCFPDSGGSGRILTAHRANAAGMIATPYRNSASLTDVRYISCASRSAIHATTEGIGCGRMSSEATLVSMADIQTTHEKSGGSRI